MSTVTITITAARIRLITRKSDKVASLTARHLVLNATLTTFDNLLNAHKANITGVTIGYLTDQRNTIASELEDIAEDIADAKFTLSTLMAKTIG